MTNREQITINADIKFHPGLKHDRKLSYESPLRDLLSEQSWIDNSRCNSFSGKTFNPVELPFSNLDKNERIILVILGTSFTSKRNPAYEN